VGLTGESIVQEDESRMKAKNILEIFAFLILLF